MGTSRSSVDVGVAVLSLLALLGALEIGFRLLDLRGFHAPRTREWQHALLPESERWPEVGIQFRPNSEFRLGYDSNPRDYFDPDNGLRYRINRHGFRGPDFPQAKPPGTRRVIVLGDSFAFGEGVRFEDTFAERMESALAAGSDAAIEVLNLGVSGASTRNEISFLEHTGLGFGPDLVLVVYVLNDANTGVNVWEDYTRQYQASWLRHSYFAGWVYARIARQIRGRRYVEGLVESGLRQRRKWIRSLEYLLEGRRLAAEHGAGFAVAIFPFMYRLDRSHPFRSFHELVTRYCEERDIAVVDLLPAFTGRTDTDLWVHPNDQHPNEIAHAIAGEALAAFVRERGLLPGPAG